MVLLCVLLVAILFVLERNFCHELRRGSVVLDGRSQKLFTMARGRGTLFEWMWTHWAKVGHTPTRSWVILRFICSMELNFRKRLATTFVRNFTFLKSTWILLFGIHLTFCLTHFTFSKFVSTGVFLISEMLWISEFTSPNNSPYGQMLKGRNIHLQWILI